jgi:hypothetical protein
LENVKQSILKTKKLNKMTPTPLEFQRAGLLAVLAQFSVNPLIDDATKLSVKQATLAVLDEHPINDFLEVKVRKDIK